MITVVLLATKPNREWFGARAIAESVKTISWRYMTRAEPYTMDLTPADADARFAREVQAVIRERSDIAASLAGETAAEDQITQRMREVRALDLGRRLSIYLESRIRDQRSWYAGSGRANAKASLGWVIGILAVQFSGVIAAIALVGVSRLQLNLPAIFASCAAAFVAWLQVRQHQELAQAYSLAAHELGLIEALSDHITSDSDLARFVSDAEAAISREHTMWVARRQVVR